MMRPHHSMSQRFLVVPSLRLNAETGKGLNQQASTNLAHPIVLAEPSKSTQHPGLAVTAREQFGGFLVVHDHFFLRVPLDLAADQHGDETQVAGDGGMMRRLDGRDGWLPRFYRIQEVA